jgi:ABC-2 type transport system permease protein
MRTFAVARRVFQQFRRDKRTLALIIVAPNLILGFLYLVFNADAYRPTVATVNVPAAMVQMMEAEDATVQPMSADDAQTAIEAGDVDAVITLNGRTPSVLLEGSDPGKTRPVQVLLMTMMQATRMGSSPPKIERLHGTEDMSAFDNFGPVLLGFFVFFFTFLVSGVAFVRERSSGTLERMLSTPLRRHELVLGYALGFSVVVLAQATLVTLVAVYGLGMMLEGSFAVLLMVILLLAATALAIGMFVSAFAASEFQVFQFIPLIIVPQVFFSGLFPLEGMIPLLRGIGAVLPLTYGADAMRAVMIRGASFADIGVELAVLTGFTVVCLAANVLALKKYRAI